MTELERLGQTIERQKESIRKMESALKDLDNVDKENWWDTFLGYQVTGFFQISEGASDAVRHISSDIIKTRFDKIPGVGKYVGKLMVDAPNALTDLAKELQSIDNPKDAMAAFAKAVGASTRSDKLAKITAVNKELSDLSKHIKNKEDLDMFVSGIKAASEISGNERFKTATDLIGDAKMIRDGQNTQAEYWDNRGRFETERDNIRSKMERQIQESKDKLKANEEKYDSLFEKNLDGFKSELNSINKKLDSFETTLKEIESNLSKLNTNLH